MIDRNDFIACLSSTALALLLPLLILTRNYLLETDFLVHVDFFKWLLQSTMDSQIGTMAYDDARQFSASLQPIPGANANLVCQIHRSFNHYDARTILMPEFQVYYVNLFELIVEIVQQVMLLAVPSTERYRLPVSFYTAYDSVKAMMDVVRRVMPILPICPIEISTIHHRAALVDFLEPYFETTIYVQQFSPIDIHNSTIDQIELIPKDDYCDFYTEEMSNQLQVACFNDNVQTSSRKRLASHDDSTAKRQQLHLSNSSQFNCGLLNAETENGIEYCTGVAIHNFNDNSYTVNGHCPSSIQPCVRPNTKDSVVSSMGVSNGHHKASSGSSETHSWDRMEEYKMSESRKHNIMVEYLGMCFCSKDECTCPEASDQNSVPAPSQTMQRVASHNGMEMQYLKAIHHLMQIFL